MTQVRISTDRSIQDANTRSTSSAYGDGAAALTKQWIVWQQARGLARRTITERVRIVSQCSRDLKAHPAEWTSELLATFLSTAPTSGTKATYHSALRSWHKWLTLAGHRDDDPTALLGSVRSPRRDPRPVATSHLEAMLNVPMWSSTRAMILLAAYQGLRVHEIAHHRGEDVDPTAERVRIRGKGGTEKWLPLHPVIAELVPTMPRRGWWFPGRGRNKLFPKGGGHLLPNSVSIRISEVMRRADVPGTAHSLRHWFGTELHSAGTDIRTVQTLMRHASLATTQIYTQVSDDLRTEAMGRLPRVSTSEPTSPEARQD